MPTTLRILLAALATAGLALSTAVACEGNPPFDAVVVAGDDVQVQDADGVLYDLANGAELLSDGIIEVGDVLWVERQVKNPRTVVALEDTHF